MDLQHLFLDSGSHRLYGVTVFPKEASWCCWNKGFLISKYFRYMNYTSQMTGFRPHGLDIPSRHEAAL